MPKTKHSKPPSEKAARIRLKLIKQRIAKWEALGSTLSQSCELSALLRIKEIVHLGNDHQFDAQVKATLRTEE